MRRENIRYVFEFSAIMRLLVLTVVIFAVSGATAEEIDPDMFLSRIGTWAAVGEVCAHRENDPEAALEWRIGIKIDLWVGAALDKQSVRSLGWTGAKLKLTEDPSFQPDCNAEDMKTLNQIVSDLEEIPTATARKLFN